MSGKERTKKAVSTYKGNKLVQTLAVRHKNDIKCRRDVVILPIEPWILYNGFPSFRSVYLIRREHMLTREKSVQWTDFGAKDGVSQDQPTKHHIYRKSL